MDSMASRMKPEMWSFTEVSWWAFFKRMAVSTNGESAGKWGYIEKTGQTDILPNLTAQRL